MSMADWEERGHVVLENIIEDSEFGYISTTFQFDLQIHFRVYTSPQTGFDPTFVVSMQFLNGASHIARDRSTRLDLLWHALV